VRYISGKATTVAAITVAGPEKTITMPICSCTWPMKLRLPSSRRRKKPTTVGGRTNGSVRRPSTYARRLPRTPDINLAASIPRKNVSTVATQVVASEIHGGE